MRSETYKFGNKNKDYDYTYRLPVIEVVEDYYDPEYYGYIHRHEDEAYSISGERIEEPRPQTWIKITCNGHDGVKKPEENNGGKPKKEKNNPETIVPSLINEGVSVNRLVFDENNNFLEVAVCKYNGKKQKPKVALSYNGHIYL